MRKIAFLFTLLFSSSVFAQNLYMKQDTRLYNGTTATGGAKLTAIACTAAAADRWTGWIYVAPQSSLVFDINFVDANSTAASLNTRCETSQVNTTVADAGRDLPVVTATSAAGVSTIMQASWSWVSTAGAAPGSSQYTITISNLPAPWINCLFTCGAGAEAADTMTVFARGITP